MTKKSPLSVSLAPTSNLQFFSKYLVPAIVFLLDRDLRCSSKLLVPLAQSAYQSPKLHSPPLLLPPASSPALHLIPSSRCRHQLEPPTLSAVYCCLLIAVSLDECGHPPGPFTPAEILPSAQPRHIFAPFWCTVSPLKDLLDCVILSKCDWFMRYLVL